MADLRSAGITQEQAGSRYLEVLIKQASALIDHYTGIWFEPRRKVFLLDGTGRRTIDLPAPAVELTTVRVDGRLLIPGDDYEVYSDGEDKDDPYLWRAAGWPKGRRNVEVDGVFGYVTEDGKPPVPIRMACELLVRRLMKRPDERRRVSQEGAEGAQVSYASDARFAGYTGDPEIDSLLAGFRRPIRLGAV